MRPGVGPQVRPVYAYMPNKCWNKCAWPCTNMDLPWKQHDQQPSPQLCLLPVNKKNDHHDHDGSDDDDAAADDDDDEEEEDESESSTQAS